jgi:hypothetical protein
MMDTSTTVPVSSTRVEASRAPVRSEAASTGAVIILQLFAITLYVFPSDTVIRPIGASGFLASLVALLALAVYFVACAIGVHRPGDVRHPLRGPLLLLWAVVLVSYGLMSRTSHRHVVLLAADRWLLMLAGVTGVVLVAAEGLPSLVDVKRVVRVIVAGGGFCGFVAALQYWAGYDLTPTLRALPGFSLNATNSAITSRDVVARVAGTAIHPIELGVVAGMILPLAVFLALHDRDVGRIRRLVPIVLIGVAIPVSVSRSGVISVVIAMGVFVVLLPPLPRLVGFALAPLGIVAVFMAAPGIVGTLNTFFSAGSGDASVATRLDDIPLVERLVAHHPWFGRGGGTYIAANALEILDNEYFKSAVELGLVGLCVLVLFWVAPVIAALDARRRSQELEVRTLCGALAGAGCAALVCAATFDALSFPMFVGTEALIIGLSACLWRLTRDGATERRAS